MWLTVIGIGLQLAGALIAARGLRQTWREFSLPGEGFLDPVTVPIRARWRRLRAVVKSGLRRLFRRGGDVVRAEAEDAIGFAEALDATVHVDYSPLDTDLEPQDAIGRLDRRTQELNRRLNVAQGEVRDLRTAHDRLLDQFGVTAAELEHQTRRVAVGGIRWAALGLFLVAIGTALELVGAAL
jgi:hypothetical protein